MTNRENYIPPVLIAGGAAGLLGGIPFINWVNCCFCAWMVGGGVLSVYLVGKHAGIPIVPQEGAIIGAITGLISGVIIAVLSVIIQLVFNFQAMPKLPSRGPSPLSPDGMGMAAAAALIVCLSLIIYPLFGALGGLLGTMIFKNKGGEGAAVAMPVSAPPPGDPGAG